MLLNIKLYKVKTPALPHSTTDAALQRAEPDPEATGVSVVSVYLSSSS